MVLAISSHRNEPMLSELLKVFGHRRLAQPERGDKLANAQFAIGGSVDLSFLKCREQLAPRAISEHVEDVGHANRLPRVA